jgi:hypothetical protein
MERVKGIEPSSVAWEATALPLSYTRFIGRVDSNVFVLPEPSGHCKSPWATTGV